MAYRDYEKILANLDEEQKKAVEYINGPSLIIAGPGSGKTRTLTCKVAYLIYNGIPPDNILCLTFTNKAAEEMKKRIASILPNINIRGLWIGTFHSLFTRILRIELNMILDLGITSNFTIYDSDDSKNLLKKIILENNLDPNELKYGKIKDMISFWKNRGLTHETFSQSEFARNFSSEELKTILFFWEEYEKSLIRANAVDFDNILLYTLRLIRKYPNVLKKYREKFSYILIDEFQDTNKIQYDICKMLAYEHRNITAVGDDCQSIYSFRGASHENIFNFTKDFPEATLFYLTKNYRSTSTIVNALNTIISNIEVKYEKTLKAEKDEYIPIKIICGKDQKDEARKIAETIFELKNRERLNYDAFAVIYRINSQSAYIEDALRKKNIPYKVYGGIGFFQRKEIKDVIAYIRCTINPLDEEAMIRVINLPKRGIGDDSLKKILTFARNNNMSIWDVITQETLLKQLNISAKTMDGIKKFTIVIEELKECAKKHTPFDFIKILYKKTELLNYYKEHDEAHNDDKCSNLEEFVNFISSLTRENPDTSVYDILSYVSLMTTQDITNSPEDAQGKVSLMTVHASKGLEFDCVIIAGVNESIFPFYLSNTPEEYEEEKRLFYVASSRAKKYLVYAYSEFRFINGNLVPEEISHFLSYIPSDYFDTTPPLKESQPKEINIKKKGIDYLPPGTWVFHDVFGKGLVLSCENGRALINFFNSGKKTLLLAYANLKVLN